MKLDILFISYNRRNEVQFNLDKMSCFSGLNKIIWVDNGSSDDVHSIKFDVSKVHFIKLSKNLGIEAYNIGAKCSDADILIILDDDSSVEEYAIEQTIKRFEEDNLLGALAYTIVLPDSNENVTKDWQVGPATYFWGCGAAVRKSIWDKLGGYRKELFLYTNEYDFCIRVWNEGFKVLFTSEIKAYHRVSSMNRTSGRLVSYSIRNNYLFIKTYFSEKYHFKLFFYDRLSWFIRATFSGAIGDFFKGIQMSKEVGLIHCYPIDLKIQHFYITNQRIFEPPLKKIIRKYKFGLLFKISKNV